VNARANLEASADWERLTATPTFAARLARYDGPALIVHGEADPRPAQYARRVAELLPRGRYVGLADVGHYPWLEDEAAFAAAVEPFLRVSSPNIVPE